MVRLQAVFLSFHCCLAAASKPLVAPDSVSDAVIGDHVSLLQRRVVASRAGGQAHEMPEPLTLLSRYADEDLQLHIEKHPRRAWRLSQGLPVAKRRPGKTGPNAASLSSGKAKTGVWQRRMKGKRGMGGKRGKRGTKRDVVSKRQELGASWVAEATEVAQRVKSEEMASEAKVTSDAMAEAARRADLDEIQNLFSENAEASKAAKARASQMWERKDAETNVSRKEHLRKELAAEKAFEEEMKAEAALDAASTTNATALVFTRPATVSAEERINATAQAQTDEESPSENNATVETASFEVDGKHSATVHANGTLEQGTGANVSSVAEQTDQAQNFTNLDVESSMAGVSQLVSSNNATEVASFLVGTANTTDALIGNATNSSLAVLIKVKDDSATSKLDGVPLQDELEEHMSNLSLTGNVSDGTLTGNVSDGTVTKVAPLLAQESKISDAANATEGSVGNVSESLSSAHVSNVSGHPLKSKFVFEIDGKNVTSAELLHAKSRQGNSAASPTTVSAVEVLPGAYYIINSKHEKYLNTLGTNVSVLQTNNVTVEEYAKGLQWRLDPVDGKNNTFHLVNVRFQTYVNSLGGPAQMWAPSHARDAARGGPASVQWKLQAVHGQKDTYYFVNEGKQKYMDTFGGTVSIWRGKSLADLGAQPGNIQWKLKKVETPETSECESYVSLKNPGCLWTGNWSCPAQAVGVKGVAGGKGGQESIGFRCCCELGLWAADYATDQAR